MDKADLRRAWHASAHGGKQNKDRPAFVREHREALAEHTAADLPPPDAELAAYREWLADHKGAVTRQLAPEDGGKDKGDGAEGEV